MQKPSTECNSFLQLFKCRPAIIIIGFWLISCTAAKRNIYFDNLPIDTTLHNLVTKDFQLKIRKGDLLNIGVNSLSIEGSALFTAPQSATGDAETAASGFMVDTQGNMLYPKLGSIHVEGLTRDELRNLLLKQLLPYLKEPIVTVNFINHKVTVMGEVSRPQVLNLAGEGLTLLQALVLCGGLSKTSRKDNVLIIRENGADKEFKRLNLDNSSVFNSPFYYLRPDDIVYVEPEIAKKGKVTTQQVITYVSTGLSLLFLILSRRN